MLDESKPIPLYKQLFEELKEKIKTGEWVNQQKIPTEVELCNQYDISRITVRLALIELQNQGYIYRRQGRGSFVKEPKVEQGLSSFYQFADELEKQGYKTKKVIIDYYKENDRELANNLHLPAEQDCFHRLKRIHYRNKTPFSVEISYIPHAICQKLTKKLIDQNGLYNSLRLYNINPDHAVENFEAIIIEEPIRTLLKTNKNSPGFYVERSTFDGNRLVEFCKSWVRGDMIRYTSYLNKYADGFISRIRK